MKKNKIIIIIVISLIVIVSAVVSFLYLKTDLFKNNKELFLKYLSQTRILDSEMIQKYENIFSTIEKSNCSSSGNFNVSTKAANNNTNISNVQQVVSLKYNTLKNVNLKQNYADVTVNSNNQDLATFRFLRDNNTYGIKMENVLAKYIGLENKNLKEFAKKIGITDTSQIPDSIPEMSIKELIDNNKDQIKRFCDKYKTIIFESINTNNITKKSNQDGTKTLVLSLSEKEMADIIIKCLEATKNDTEILNYIIENANSLGYTLNIDSLKTSIQEYIDEINNSQNIENKEFISISLTTTGSKTTNINIKVQLDSNSNNEMQKYINSEEQVEISIDFLESNQFTVWINNNNKNNYKLEASFIHDTSNLSAIFDIYQTDEQKNTIKTLAKLQYQVDNSDVNTIVQNATINVNMENGNETQININNSTQLKQDIEIEKMNDQNTEILNNKTQKELQNLIAAIIKRIEYVYGEDVLNNNSLIKNMEF